MKKPLHRDRKYKIEHCRDNYLNLGFDYRKNLLPKTLSKQLFANDKNGGMLLQIQKLVFFLIEETKILKTRFTFAVNKNSKLIN